METKKAGKVCAAINCRNKAYLTKASFFRFPKDTARAVEWLTACGRLELLKEMEKLNGSYRLCSGHFADEMFANKKKTSLKRFAVLTIFSACNDLIISREHSYSLFSAPISNGEGGKDPHNVFPMVDSGNGATDAASGGSYYEPQYVLGMDDSVDRVEDIITISTTDYDHLQEETKVIDEKLLMDIDTEESYIGKHTPRYIWDDSPQIHALKKTLKILRRKMSYLEKRNEELRKELIMAKKEKSIDINTFKKSCFKFCSKELATFINVQLTEGIKKAKGRRFSIQFKRASLSLYLANPKLYRTTLRKKYCLPNSNTLLKLIEHIKLNPGLHNTEFFKYLDSTPVEVVSALSNFVHIGDKVYQTSDMLEKNFTKYICGYLIRKCLSIHSCEICVEYANKEQDLDDSTLFCHLKAYETNNFKTFGNLLMPQEDFVYYIASLEILFRDNFKHLIVTNNVLHNFVNLFNTRSHYKHPCPSFPYKYVVNLYSRMKVFYSLKYINRNFRANKGNKFIVWKQQ